MNVTEQTKKSAEIYAKANDAFFDDDYDEALSLFSQLVDFEPENAEFILKRCSVYQKVNKLDLALKDVEKALDILKHGSRSLMARAHLQKGIILHRLERYKEAEEHLNQSKELNPNEKTLTTWLRKNADKLKEVNQLSSNATINTTTPVPVESTNKPLNTTARHEWFQNDNFVTIEVFVKKVMTQDVSVGFYEDSLSLAAKLPSGSTYSIELDPLAHKIIPEESTYKVLSTKIEVKLKKKVPGIMWGALEGENDLGTPAPAVTNNKKQTKDWNKLIKEVDDEKLEGEAAVNALFQQIYRDADPDARRAMMKSFIESNGTCLSTNWSEVGSKKVETKPPEGTMVKKFDE